MTMKLQTILIPRRNFTLRAAKAWIRKHGFRLTFFGKPVDITTNYYRFRQSDPVQHAKYFTKVLPNGIELIMLQNIYT